jgi:hypothetical protein
MTQTIRLRNKLIKLIKFLTWKQTHKTHKLIRGGCAILSTGKQTHKTHKTHKKSNVNKLIKLIAGAGNNQTHDFGASVPLPDWESGRFIKGLQTSYEFYEFPPALTCEGKQGSIDLKHVQKGTAGKLIELVKLIQPTGGL